VEKLTGDEAVLEAEVSIVDESTFTETGTIRYGGRVASPLPRWGRESWFRATCRGPPRRRDVEGDGGRRALRRRHGIITSNFAVSPDGEVVDNHYARIYILSKRRLLGGAQPALGAFTKRPCCRRGACSPA